MQFRTKEAGFTLIEALLYLTIAGTVLYFISGFTANTFFGKSKVDTLHDLDQTNQLIAEDINKTIREATDFSIVEVE